LGNIYDNVEKPRKVTFFLLVILAVISLVEAIFSEQLESASDTPSASSESVALTLY
jgi:hypothetical protein